MDVLLESMVSVGLHGDKIVGTRITCFQAIVAIYTCCVSGRVLVQLDHFPDLVYHVMYKCVSWMSAGERKWHDDEKKRDVGF